jgi:hypothetical protein
MGYACPVCETPQQDAAHLADHLAFTAIVHTDDHESWLEDTLVIGERMAPMTS